MVTRALCEALSSHTGLKLEVSVLLPGQEWREWASPTGTDSVGASGLQRSQENNSGCSARTSSPPRSTLASPAHPTRWWTPSISSSPSPHHLLPTMISCSVACSKRWGEGEEQGWVCSGEGPRRGREGESRGRKRRVAGTAWG